MGTFHFLLILSFHASAAIASSPNIVHIVVDDLGWSYRPGSDNSNEESQTPNMNSLVNNGLYLDRFYVHKICSPSRSALLSGRSSIHVNVENVGPEVYNPAEPLTGYQGVALNMTLMSGHLQSAGYTTRFVGKWDIGMATVDHHPKNRGFDSWFGYWHHANDYWQQTEGTCPTSALGVVGGKDTVAVQDLWRYDSKTNLDGPAYDSSNDDTCSQIHQDGDQYDGGTCVYEEDLLRQEASNIISTHNTTEQGPLFLMYAMHLVHWPLQVPQDKVEQFKSVDDERRRKMASMVSYMDDSVGLIIDSIQANSDSSSVFWDNTLVVLHSDNGGEIIFVGTCGGNNYPLRGGKFSNWEGGVRSFGIVSGGYLPEARRGIIESNLVGIEDWYATYCGLLGIDPSDQVAENSDLPAIDSINQWSLVLGDYDTPPRTEVVIGDTSALGYNGQGDTLVGGLIRLVNGTFYKLLIGASNKDYMIDQDVLPGPFFPDVHDIHGDASNVPLLLRPQAHTRQCSRTLSTSFTLTKNQTSTTCLFDVVSNPTEDPDYELAAQLPDLFQDMLSRIDELQATVLSPFRGEEDPMACDQALNGYNGYWGPWLGLEGTN